MEGEYPKATSVSAWIKYCQQQQIDILAPSLPQLLDFPTIQSNKLGHSPLGTTRSALSSFIIVDGCKPGEHPLVLRYTSGVFNRKPTFPRYVYVWDPQTVLTHLKGYPDIKRMTLKHLTFKMTVLMTLVSA